MNATISNLAPGRRPMLQAPAMNSIAKSRMVVCLIAEKENIYILLLSYTYKMKHLFFNHFLTGSEKIRIMLLELTENRKAVDSACEISGNFSFMSENGI